MSKIVCERYGRIGLALVLSALILGGAFAMLQGAVLPTAAQPVFVHTAPEVVGLILEATGVVISETSSGTVFFNNTAPGVLTLTFTLTGAPPLTFTAAPAFGLNYALTSAVAPWQAVLTYPVGTAAPSYPNVEYVLTDTAQLTTTKRLSFIRDIAGPQLTPASIPIWVSPDPGLYAAGSVLYYTNTTGNDLFFNIRGTAADALAGPGTLVASPALGAAAPVNNGTWENWIFTYRVPSGATTSGNIVVTATDAVQNRSTLTFAYVHDPHPPTGAIQIAGGAPYISSTTASLQLTADDGAGSGVARMCLSNTPDCVDWQPFTETVEDWALTDGDGEKIVYVRYRDHLRNTSGPIPSLAIFRDTTRPVVTVTAPSRVAVPFVEVSWTADDQGGLPHNPKYTVDYREDEGPWQRWLTNTGLTHTIFTSQVLHLDHTYTFRVTVKDRAGNEGIGTAVTRVGKYRVYLPLTLRAWVSWYAFDIYEPNDTPAEAWGPLVSNTVYQSYIWNETDRNDYYHFTPSASGIATVVLSNIPGNVDYDLYIYYHDGNAYQLVGYSNLTGSPTERVEFNVTAGRKYYVRVYPYAGFNSTQPYSLRATYP